MSKRVRIDSSKKFKPAPPAPPIVRYYMSAQAYNDICALLDVTARAAAKTLERLQEGANRIEIPDFENLTTESLVATYKPLNGRPKDKK